MATSPRPITDLYLRYRVGEVPFEELKQRVERATEDYRRARTESDAARDPD